MSMAAGTCGGVSMASSSDRILIDGLRLECVIGVGEEERLRPQELRLDVELEVDLSRAGRTDEIVDTVDYGALARRLQEVARTTSDRLLERLAERIAGVCLEDPRVRAAHITLTKPGAVKAARGAGVQVHRARQS